MENNFTEVNFNQYVFNELEIEKVIEIWKHFFPKDNPEPTKDGKILISKKYDPVDPLIMAMNLAYPVMKTCAWVSRFYNSTMHVRTQKPMDFLYDKFMENCLGEKVEKVREGDYEPDAKKRSAAKRAENKTKKKETK